jgi:LPXTG-motif cell wall-anchored protein
MAQAAQPSMPQTASDYPLIALVGLLLIAAALGVKVIAKQIG